MRVTLYELLHPLRRLPLVALLGALLIAGSGWLVELWWLGGTRDDSYRRVQEEIQGDFFHTQELLRSLAVELAANPIVTSPAGPTEPRARLFELARSAVARFDDPSVSATIYDAGGTARAWAGRPSDLTMEPAPGQGTFFVSAGERDIRLAYIEPIAGDAGQTLGRRPGTVLAERVISSSPVAVGPSSGTGRLTSSIVDVQIHAPSDRGSSGEALVFPLRSPSGDHLLDVEVRAADLDRVRGAVRRRVLGLVLGFLGGIALLATGPAASRPRRGVPQRLVLPRALAAILGIGATYLCWRSASSLLLPESLGVVSSTTYRSPALPFLLRHPADVLLTGLLVLALVFVGAVAVEQIRLGKRPRRNQPGHLTAAGAVAQLAASTAALGGLLAFDLLVADIFEGTSVDLLHTSLQPWDSGRVTLLVGVLLTSAATLWGMTLALSAARIPWATLHGDVRHNLLTVILWLAPAAFAMSNGWIDAHAALPFLGGSIALALLIPLARPKIRHASQAARMSALLAALVLPCLLSYPSLLTHGEETKRRFVETQYAVQAAGHSEQLQRDLDVTLAQLDHVIDAEVRLPQSALVARRDEADRAFELWRQTELASRRLTSSVELYARDGHLLSRFALNLPEYTNAPLARQVSGCAWDVFGEIVPFGSEQRRVLHAERALCPSDHSPDHPGDRIAGSLVVHVALDYRTLPFISPDNPYTDLLGPSPPRPLHDSVGQDVELVIYGWGLQPVFSSSQEAWSIDDTLFARIYASRTPFWTTRSKGGRTYETHVANNRIGIYIVGFPDLGVFDHLVHLAEIATLSALIFVLLTIGIAVASHATAAPYRIGHALLREVRTSFYRRLFLAFIAATLVPVLALAVVIRNYVTAQLRADVEAGAARTATVAQRVIEDSVVFQQVGQIPTAVVNDDLMVWISQVLDQEINIYRGSQLVATSERDLFAFGLLPTRTPDAVFSAILLDHMPSYVMEESTGALPYLIAATPIRTLGADTVLTVSLASRQQAIERQIEDLDRGILLGVVFFVLLGAAIGLSMAERIADPVRRLTRATGQIARGDFDAHIAARSADELQQLVVSFNQMADDLKRQQTQLEKTHRLEAWADMARQVAHDIKNPLTPVQLSAEHLLRVHADHGEPLGPVVRECVESILAQVRLLRQISSEFSSYATQPTVEPQPTDVHELVTSVLEPYRVGLAHRVRIDIGIDSDVPLLDIDRTLVARALTNVVENALHAMPGGGTLDVRAATGSSSVILTVTDTGVGLDADTLRRIFEPYFSTKVTGTGLGMAIAKRNIELNGGTIEVESQRDQGTTVTVRFPCPSSKGTPHT